MKKIHIIFLLSAIITPNITFGADPQCHGKSETACKDANCQWEADENVENGGICKPCGSGTVGINGECKQCEANQYIKDGKCEACPAPYKNSDPGSDEITDCYQRCETDETVDNGKIVFQDPNGESVSRIYWSTRQDKCSDYKKIICDNDPNNICQSYHLENNACEPNWTTETKDNDINCKTYLTLYKNNNWSKTKYCIACKDNYHKKTTDPIENCTLENQTSPVTKTSSCEANSKNCNDLNDNGLNGAQRCEYEQGGNNPTYEWNGNGFDYSSCNKICDVRMDNGYKSYRFTYNSAGGIWVRSDNPVNNTPTSCDQGYCLISDTCVQASGNIYADPKTSTCKTCPGGTTTKEDGATSIDACKVSKETKFCNSSGSCFTLPIGDNVYLNPPAAIFGTSN